VEILHKKTLFSLYIILNHISLVTSNLRLSDGYKISSDCTLCLQMTDDQAGVVDNDKVWRSLLWALCTDPGVGIPVPAERGWGSPVGRPILLGAFNPEGLGKLI
jgi:hypothetical protein